MTEEQSSDRVEYSPRHLQHVFHDLLHRCVGDGHVDGSDSNHEIETGDNVSGVLYKFVEVGKVMPTLGVCVI